MNLLLLTWQTPLLLKQVCVVLVSLYSIMLFSVRFKRPPTLRRLTRLTHTIANGPLRAVRTNLILLLKVPWPSSFANELCWHLLLPNWIKDLTDRPWLITIMVYGLSLEYLCEGTIVKETTLASVSILSWHILNVDPRENSSEWSEVRLTLVWNSLVLLGRIMCLVTSARMQALKLLALGAGSTLLCPIVWHLFAPIPSWESLVMLPVRTLKASVVSADALSTAWLPMGIQSLRTKLPDTL